MINLTQTERIRFAEYCRQEAEGHRVMMLEMRKQVEAGDAQTRSVMRLTVDLERTLFHSFETVAERLSSGETQEIGR